MKEEEEDKSKSIIQGDLVMLFGILVEFGIICILLYMYANDCNCPCK